ncbi:hypothetical protein OOK60_14075 [Trichothermofontia sichuanensis B231]|uniref:hypothetical protein n=1 Tax=Trichothermofontia sichuanensis TaxID=3045816 RepID=UPI002247F0AD|nr:hypothetical protein OOK60_14075 [Trichothermofontia sichuanensis B231]
MIVGLGTGSTTAYAIQSIGERLRAGDLKDIKGVPTSFQAIVLAKEYGIPLTTLDEVEKMVLLGFWGKQYQQLQINDRKC